MDQIHFHHALKVDLQKCFGCTHCLQVCPTEAIRIYKGKANIREGRCVDCGECMRSCPVNAFYIEQDDLNLIHNYRHRVVLFPSVMIGQFPIKITQEQIYNALLKIGFTHVYEVEQPIEILMEAREEYFADPSHSRPFISTYCPAVVRLIQVRYPSLVDHLVHIKVPQDLSAIYIKEKLLLQGAKEEEIGIFYITPCAAKIAAVKSPVGEKQSIVNGVINMKEAYNRIMTLIKQEGCKEELPGFFGRITREGMLWPLTNGEASLFKGRAFAIDGIQNVIQFLELIENEEAPDIDFLEMRSCDESCAGGILLSGNRFLTVQNLIKRATKFPSARTTKELNLIVDIEKIKQLLQTEKIKPRSMLMLDTDRARAYEKMQKARTIMCHLPAIDCGSCGAPSCMALAEDMVQHKAKMSDCIFMQQLWQHEGKIHPEKAFHNVEKKWGQNRFKPNCNKKGAKNEGL
ncbi:MAG: [Fe-Fe] hydrogenase large subunit C-terminal domain-containing protein [Bacteroidota bacterium]|nr:[Fe-Fe] hydrogenase large subunit C-terminal domain-containing protein [Bacteroidota bacterium]